MHILERANLDSLFELLREQGYEVVGPTLQDQAIVYDTISQSKDLPEGWTDSHGKGSYRTERTGTGALFHFAAGARSLKHFLNPPRRLLWRAHGSSSDFTAEIPQEEVPRYAFVGVRPCELAAVAIQDRVHLEGEYVDPVYKARREQAVLIALNCAAPSDNCFCTSMGTGSEVTGGADLVLTEVLEGTRHFFTLYPMSDRGEELLAALHLPIATQQEIEQGQAVVAQAAEQVQRHVEREGLKEALYASLEDEHWEAIAERCMSCSNCTMACPTCFCSTVEDTTSLAGDSAERWKVWDSCFTSEFSYIHGGSVRKSTSSRYRQWLTHKFASWDDQFGTLGCVGCGRCITWCPAKIDVTEELAHFQAEAQPTPQRKEKLQPA